MRSHVLWMRSHVFSEGLLWPPGVFWGLLWASGGLLGASGTLRTFLEPPGPLGSFLKLSGPSARRPRKVPRRLQEYPQEGCRRCQEAPEGTKQPPGSRRRLQEASEIRQEVPGNPGRTQKPQKTTRGPWTMRPQEAPPKPPRGARPRLCLARLQEAPRKLQQGPRRPEEAQRAHRPLIINRRNLQRSGEAAEG